MARMGKADAQARAGQLDAAIATWKELAAQTTADLPVDAMLMELARAYVQKGNTEEARKTFTQIVDQHPARRTPPRRGRRSRSSRGDRAGRLADARRAASENRRVGRHVRGRRDSAVR